MQAAASALLYTERLHVDVCIGPLHLRPIAMPYVICVLECPACRIHSAAEASHAQWVGRVPSGHGFYSLRARVAAVQLTFMQRFIDELAQYIFGEWAGAGFRKENLCCNQAPYIPGVQ